MKRTRLEGTIAELKRSVQLSKAYRKQSYDYKKEIEKKFLKGVKKMKQKINSFNPPNSPIP